MARPAGDDLQLVARRSKLRISEPSSHAAQAHVVVLEGEFDLDNVPEIDRFLRRALGPLYHRDHLVIDLAATTYVDSSFIAFLIRLVDDLRGRHKELILVRPAGQVRRVLGIVGLPNVVPVFDSVEEAVGTLAAGPLPMIPPAFGPAGI